MNKARFPVSRKKLASDEDVRGKRKTAFPWKSCTSPRVLRDKDLSAGTGRLITLPTWDLLTERRELGASLPTARWGPCQRALSGPRGNFPELSEPGWVLKAASSLWWKGQRISI